MERGTHLPLRCLRPSAPAGPALQERATGPGRRGRHAPPRGCCLAKTGGPSGTASCRSSGTRWFEPASVGCPPGTLLCQAGDPPAMASRFGATEVDLSASTARTAGYSSGHGLPGSSSGKREPDLGLSADPGGAGHDGSSARPFERVGDPPPPRHRTIAEALWPDLVRVPAGPSDDHAGL